MCGMTGIFGQTLTLDDKEVFRHLMFLNAWRGNDSTGVLVVDEPNKKAKKAVAEGRPLRYRLVKQAVPSPFFLDNKSVDKVLQTYSPNKRLMIGHTRAATIGEVSDDNSHPFAFDSIVGMVNGTIPKHQFSAEYKDEYETDAETLVAMLQDLGPEKALKEVMAFDKAPFALVYLDLKNATINFIRNDTEKDGRPLCFIRDKSLKKLIFSSDGDMIKYVGKYLKYDFEDDAEPLMYKPNKLVTFDLLDDNPITTAQITVIEPPPKPVVIEPEPYWKRNQTQMSQHFPSSGMNSDAGRSHKTRKLVQWKDKDGKTKTLWPVAGKPGVYSQHPQFTPEAEENGFQIGPESSMFGDFGNSDLSEDVGFISPFGLKSKSEFRELCQKGCCVCSDPVNDEKFDIDKRIVWTNLGAGNEIVCEDCKDDQWFTENYARHVYNVSLQGWEYLKPNAARSG